MNVDIDTERSLEREALLPVILVIGFTIQPISIPDLVDVVGRKKSNFVEHASEANTQVISCPSSEKHRKLRTISQRKPL